MLDNKLQSDVYIITGASRGLGEAFVRRLLRPGRHLLCVARSDNAALRREAEASGARLDWFALPYGAKLTSVAPGVVDTAMQASIRASDERSFRDLPRFCALHETGALTPPDTAAERLWALLEHPDFGAEPVVDIRDFA